MGWGQDDAVWLQRGNGCPQFALDMIIVGIDQFKDHPVSMFGTFQHATQKHLVYPVGPLAVPPIGNCAFPVVDRKDQVRT